MSVQRTPSPKELVVVQNQGQPSVLYPEDIDRGHYFVTRERTSLFGMLYRSMQWFGPYPNKTVAKERNKGKKGHVVFWDPEKGTMDDLDAKELDDAV